jgi:hypothetical protein
METQPSVMGNTPSTGTSKAAPKISERRGSRRCKITQLMRIRPSDPEKEHFEDMRGTLSVSRTGVYYQTSEPSYEIGMSLNREYLAEVVRRDPLSTGMFGIGLKILMAMGVQQAHTPDIWSTGR